MEFMLNSKSIIRFVKKLCILIVFFVGFETSSIAQKTNPIKLSVCTEIENRISVVVTSSKVGRRALEANLCDVYIYSGKEWFSLKVTKYESLTESAEEFSDSFDLLTLAETYPESVRWLNLDKVWSEAKGYYRKGDSDHLVILRYKKINIQLIGSNYRLLLKVERLLKRIDFEKYSD
jgi:hypothetical protein